MKHFLVSHALRPLGENGALGSDDLQWILYRATRPNPSPDNPLRGNWQAVSFGARARPYFCAVSARRESRFRAKRRAGELLREMADAGERDSLAMTPALEGNLVLAICGQIQSSLREGADQAVASLGSLSAETATCKGALPRKQP